MFFEVLSILIMYPILAVIPAAGFYLAYRSTGLRIAFYTALLWLIYLIYETAILYGWACDADCNIRVDLLVIYPVLVVLSLLALVRIFMFYRRNKSAD